MREGGGLRVDRALLLRVRPLTDWRAHVRSAGSGGRGGARERVAPRERPPREGAAPRERGPRGVGRRHGESAADYLERLNRQVDEEQQGLRREELELRRIERRVADEEDAHHTHRRGGAGGGGGDLLRGLLGECRAVDAERRGHLAPKEVWQVCCRAGLATTAAELKQMCERCDFDAEGDVNYAQLLGMVVEAAEGGAYYAAAPDARRQPHPISMPVAASGGGPRMVEYGGAEGRHGHALPPPEEHTPQRQAYGGTREAIRPQDHLAPYGYNGYEYAGGQATPGKEHTPGAFMSALSNMHGSVTNEEALEKERRREQLRRDLDEQVAAKKARDRARAEELRRLEEREEAAAAEYNPWGRGGGGAPLRDEHGEVVSDLRRAPDMTPRGAKGHSQNPNADADRYYRDDERAGERHYRPPPPAEQFSPGGRPGGVGPGEGPVSPGMFMNALSQLHGAPTQAELSEQERRRQEYVAHLDAQVREKKERAAAKKRAQEEAERRDEEKAKAYLRSKVNERHGEVGIRGEVLELPPPRHEPEEPPPPPPQQQQPMPQAMSPIPGLEHLSVQQQQPLPSHAPAARQEQLPMRPPIGVQTAAALGSDTAVALLQELRDEQERMRGEFARQAGLMERLQEDASEAHRQRDAAQAKLQEYRSRGARGSTPSRLRTPGTPIDFQTSSHFIQKDVNSVPSPGQLHGVEWSSRGASPAAMVGRERIHTLVGASQAEVMHAQHRRPTHDERVALGGGMMGGGGAGAANSATAARPPRPRQQQRAGERLKRTAYQPAAKKGTKGTKKGGRPVPIDERPRFR